MAGVRATGGGGGGQAEALTEDARPGSQHTSERVDAASGVSGAGSLLEIMARGYFSHSI